MSFFKKIISKQNTEKEQKGRLLFSLYQSVIEGPYSPFKQALDNYSKLEEVSGNLEELAQALLEDTIFCSLTVTFYEEMFSALYDNPNLALKLVDDFIKTEEERSGKIEKIASDHLLFVLNNGTCDGCISCGNHQDVSGLVGEWSKGNLVFFVKMYIGMQTIQSFMEFILYDIVGETPEIVSELNWENVQAIRETIYDYTQKKLKELDHF